MTNQTENPVITPFGMQGIAEKLKQGEVVRVAASHDGIEVLITNLVCLDLFQVTANKISEWIYELRETATGREMRLKKQV